MDGGTTSLPPIVDTEPDYRRWSDNILHWQERPYVYPFSDKGMKPGTLPATPKPYTTMYTSDFVPKPLSVRRLRPTSIHRFHKPHPKSTFHINQATDKKISVVRTRMTLEQLNDKPVSSPMISNSHRTYKGARLSSSQKARQVLTAYKVANGIVPEIPKDGELVETCLFPSIPRNARLTADRASKITNAIIKPNSDKKQPHLKGSMKEIMRRENTADGPIYPYLPVKDLNRPALKPLTGRSNTMEVPEWDGAPKSQATTTRAVYGRKRKFSAYIDPLVDAVAPDVPLPSSKELMFKEYAQYPKYAPQILDGYYNSMQIKNLDRRFKR